MEKSAKVGLLIILAIAVCVIAYAQSPPILPDKFTGSVMIDAEAAPIGTQIEVYVDGTYESTAETTEEGSYTAYAKTGSYNDEITFMIMEQEAGSALRKGGKTVTLNLEVYNDRDEDGINDSIDNLIGKQGSIDNNYDNLKIYIDDSDDLDANLTGMGKIKIYDNGNIILEFNFDFGNDKLNLYNVHIIKEEGDTGSLLIRGIGLPEGETKTAYMNKLNSSDHVCIKDAEITEINAISAACNDTDEKLIRCDGNNYEGYTCTDLTDKFRITGLKHSGIEEYVCEENWQCTAWSSCSGGTQTRTCTDANNCGTTISKPSESQSCTTTTTTTSSGGGGGGGAYIPKKTAEDTEKETAVKAEDPIKENTEEKQETMPEEQNLKPETTVTDKLTGAVVASDGGINYRNGIIIAAIIIVVGFLFIKGKAIFGKK